MNPIRREDITGLVLTGGRGARMGGVDKGLQGHRGVPLAMHALLRLAPQVGETMLNANRNLGAYESMGVPVWPDSLADYAGPLAGFLTGLERCETPYLVTVPCDSPLFPEDLVERLARALESADAEIAIAATRSPEGLQVHPVFCLMKAELLESLVRFTASGQRKIDRWTGGHRCVEVLFDDDGAFVNANTPGELQRLQTHMAEDIVIRRMAASDLRAYKALRDEMLDRHPEAFTSDAQTEGHRRADDYLPRLGLNRPEGGHLLLGAWRNAELVGAVGLERDSRPKVRHIGRVIGTMVRDSARRQGVGRALLDALIAEAREPARLELLTLSVTDGNASATRLYEGAGFERFGVLRRAIRLGDRYHDKIYMAKRL